MKQTRPPQGAQAALRAVRLLKLFSNERPEMSLAELSRASGLNKTTTHRLLRALQSESLVDRNPATSAYSLGPGLMALGVQALASSDLRRRVRPVLRSLARETGETATLEIPFEESMLILDEDTDMVAWLRRVTHFYHHESCGQCTPCREGTGWLENIVTRIEEGEGHVRDLDLLTDLCSQMEGRTVCALADAAAWPVRYTIERFRDEFEARCKQTVVAGGAVLEPTL